jgi:hypothetical protein
MRFVRLKIVRPGKKKLSILVILCQEIIFYLAACITASLLVYSYQRHIIIMCLVILKSAGT